MASDKTGSATESNTTGSTTGTSDVIGSVPLERQPQDDEFKIQDVAAGLGVQPQHQQQSNHKSSENPDQPGKEESQRSTPVVRFFTGPDEIVDDGAIVASPDSESDLSGPTLHGTLSPQEYSAIRQSSVAIQQRRLSHFDYLPLSLPPSRVSSFPAIPFNHTYPSLAAPSLITFHKISALAEQKSSF